ncbi:hypothetical protein PHYSODRAFT_294219 [Phytophthora sojae]|uniref:Uncharacterized protein n=1 Tax=Phytophthora sojae (strain P6497) TaxID=1094619 RepID=G4YHI0_PHYSP|nr:hypothetical protein PHYSODRAFT_294219 [Phytophthora sojae]EGZ28768.1 hypothetical protein PHYSODRAFT_294219 [Phytophthora sojae]|eukprot:XP_009516043.1 hypothetical protein PHYSODRAFT_294219 [Phytophthora sojae]
MIISSSALPLSNGRFRLPDLQDAVVPPPLAEAPSSSSRAGACWSTVWDDGRVPSQDLLSLGSESASAAIFAVRGDQGRVLSHFREMIPSKIDKGQDETIEAENEELKAAEIRNQLDRESLMEQNQAQEFKLCSEKDQLEEDVRRGQEEYQRMNMELKWFRDRHRSTAIETEGSYKYYRRSYNDQDYPPLQIYELNDKFRALQRQNTEMALQSKSRAMS